MQLIANQELEVQEAEARRLEKEAKKARDKAEAMKKRLAAEASASNRA